MVDSSLQLFGLVLGICYKDLEVYFLLLADLKVFLVPAACFAQVWGCLAASRAASAAFEH